MTVTEPIPAETATPTTIRAIIGMSLDQFNIPVGNGCEIVARVKVTYRSGLIHTNRLHFNIIYPSGRVVGYSEQKDGSFLTAVKRAAQ